MGFQSQDIDALYQKMIANQVDIVAKLNDLPAIENYDWPKKYFLIQDPDGNYIQFFSQTQETQMDTRLHPFLIAVSTPNIGSVN